MVDRRIPTKEEIERFLEIFKSCWDGKVIPRADQKNDETLAILGITPQHRLEEVKRLHDEQIIKEWWKFGRWIKRHEIYIKICVYQNAKGQYRGQCMSFHIAEGSINYPFKERK